MRTVIISLLFFFASTAAAQTALAMKQPLAARHVEDVCVSGQGVSSILARVALEYDVPIGLQLAMNSDYFAEQRLEFKDGTVAQLLEQFVVEHKEYSWQITDEVAYVFPKQTYRDPILEELLSVKIGKFSLGKRTLAWDVERRLLETRELKSLTDAYSLSSNGWSGSLFYIPQLGQNYELNVSNLTVQSILNRIVTESPNGKFWSIDRDSLEHSLRIRLAVNHEDAPKNWRPIRAAELIPCHQP